MTLSLGQGSASLVIRSGSVELLAMRGKQVVSSLRQPVEGPEPRDLADAMRRAVASAGMKHARVAVAIPSHEVLFRFFTIPIVSKSELETAVQFEVRKYIPFKTELLIWDFHVIPSSAPNRLEVIFGGMLKEPYERIREALAEAGLQPILIEPRSLSLARLVKLPKEPSANDFVCLVEIDEESAHLAIIKDQLPYLTRDVSFSPPPELQAAGGSRLPSVDDPSLSQALRESPPQNIGVPPPHGVSQMVGPSDQRLQRLLSELSVSMDFFTREYPSTTIRQVFLLGEDSLVASWCEWLSSRLHCGVASGRKFLEPHVRGSVPLIFAAGVGAIQAAKHPQRYITLNFLKRSLASKAKIPGVPEISAMASGWRVALRGVRGGLLATIIGGLLASMWIYGSLEVAAQRRQLARLIQARPSVGWGLSAMTQKELEQLKGTAQARTALLKGVIDGRTRVAAKFDALARALPDGVWLTALLFEDRLESGKSQQKLVLNGSCFLGEPDREMQAIQTLEEHIKGNATFFQGFHMAQLDQVGAAQAGTQQPYSYRTFQLTCTPAARERS